MLGNGCAYHLERSYGYAHAEVINFYPVMLAATNERLAITVFFALTLRTQAVTFTAIPHPPLTLAVITTETAI